ncbi:MAG: hypothetical protein WDM79_08820 [Terricaulis sp.]
MLRAHDSNRDVDDALIEEVQIEQAQAPILPPQAGEVAAAQPLTLGGGASPSSQRAAKPPKRAATPTAPAPIFNPVGFFQREGAEALAATLEAHDRAALIALIAEHNLDPGGEAANLDRDALAAHVLAQAKRRAERDSKLFDY